MSKVLGKDTVLYIQQNGTFTPVGCSRNCVFTTTTEKIGKSTIGSGLFREYKQTVSGASISIDGLVTFDDNIPASSLRTYQLNLTPLNFQFILVDSGGEGVIYSGVLLIDSVSETGNYNDIATYSIQATITGEIIITSTVGNPDVIYFGVQDTSVDPIDFTRFITGDANNDITINYGHETESLFYWMAHTIGALQKTNWEDQNDTGNASTIGAATDLYSVRVITINGSSFLLYMTRYVTGFNGYDAIVKYYRIPGGCLPPTGFTITDITNSGNDTGSVTVVPNVGGQIITIFGVPQPGGVFTVSIYGVLITAGVDFDTPNDVLAASLAGQINAAAIPVPLANQPPTVVAASHTSGFDMFTVVSGTPPAASANYLPASLADVTFDFIEPVDVGLSYTIRIINSDLGTTAYDTGGAAPRIISVRRGYNYKFAIRTDCDNGSSNWSSDLIQLIP